MEMEQEPRLSHLKCGAEFTEQGQVLHGLQGPEKR